MATAKSQAEHDRLVDFVQDKGERWIWLGMTDHVNIDRQTGRLTAGMHADRPS